MPLQTTIHRAVEVAGVGLHTAVPGHLRLAPAPADTGIVFRRTDLDNFPIEAHVRNVARVSYATSLMKKGVLISTTEHLLAALYSCGIDNCYADLDAIEVPILDGSAQPFIEMLGRAGIRTLRRRRRYLRVLKPLEITDAGRSIGIYPAEEFRVQCSIDFPHPAIGRQHVDLRVDRDSFSHLLAPARTFGFERDFEGMRKMGLIRGGSYDNALVLSDQAVINGPLRFADEFGRHKTLDLIGDLALVGRPLRGLVVAQRAGHALHTQFVTRLLADPSRWEEAVAEVPAAPRLAAAAAAPATAD
ncbi:MAG TPA: UDP-3-O-acyl-N-acetylglucosamine deacetylase [Patescibacteria group bacterium]|nr:UDP-3-O-acyl-N-acetylglucosamine deacetylase [Patescibacteria group bacterium]